jgi:hypothetical protein
MNVRGINLEYCRLKLETTRKEYVRHILDIHRVKEMGWHIPGICWNIPDRTYRVSGHICGIFQEYVQITSFYGSQMNPASREIVCHDIRCCAHRMFTTILHTTL